MCMCGMALLKAKNVLSIFLPFFSLFTGIGQNWSKLLCFIQNLLVSYLLMYFAIV